MKEIGQFLGKFNSVALKEIRKREVICEIIKNIIKQDIKIEDISFSNKTIKIKGSAIFKNQILIKKDALLKEIGKKLSNITDIQ